MLRAASGQLGTAIVGPVPLDTINLPRLKAIASSSGSFAISRPLGGKVREAVSVVMVNGAGAALGRAMTMVRVVRSQRNWICVPYIAIDPSAVAKWLHWPVANGRDLPASNVVEGCWAAA